MTNMLRVALGCAGVVLVSGICVFAHPVGTDLYRNSGRQPGQISGSARISGHVLTSDGRAVRGATVRLTGPAGFSAVTLTDNSGTFQFAKLPAGSFSLGASKLGYLDANYGQREPGTLRPGTSLAVPNAANLTDLVIRMARGGAISGTITDETGDPAYLTLVQALRYSGTGDSRTLVVAGSAVADDRGNYRIPMLPTGTYFVLATGFDELPISSLGMAADSFASGRGSSAFAVPFLNRPNGELATSSSSPTRRVGYAPVYFPASINPIDASAVPLSAGKDLADINIQLLHVPLGTLEGTITGGDSKVVRSTAVTLRDLKALPGANPKTARPDANGHFQFSGVRPGEYELMALAQGPGSTLRDSRSGGMVQVFSPSSAPFGPQVNTQGPPGQSTTMWATADVVVDGGSTVSTTLVLAPAMGVSGTVTFEGLGARPSDLKQIQLYARSLGVRAESPVAPIDSKGEFRFEGLVPGRYRLGVVGSGTWVAETALVGDRDILDSYLEVRPGQIIPKISVSMTQRASAVTGVLLDQYGHASPDLTVILFPSDKQLWTSSRRIIGVRPSNDGRFNFGGLPPGDYKLAAVDDIDVNGWFDPALLTQLSNSAVSFRLAKGETHTQDLKIK